MAGTKLTPEFYEKTVVIRGVTYKFRELSATEYEECLRIATNPDEESADLSALLKLMVTRSMIDPKMNAEDYGKMPFPVVRRLNDVVNKMHFPDVDEDEPVVEGETPNA